jgi:uncharacterized membrane protein
MNDATKEVAVKDSNLKGALCYFPFIGWIVSIFFILTERDDLHVRFNALQSIMFLFTFLVLYTLLGLLSGLLTSMIYVELILSISSNVVALGYLIISLILIYESYVGKKFMLPRLGGLAEKNV